MRNPEFITSPANPLLKDVRKALSRGGLTGGGWCVAETFHLLEEALRSNCRIHAVITGESARPAVESRLGSSNGIRMVVVPDQLVDAASQGVVALVEPSAWEASQTFGSQALVLIVDGVQDPGNLGTILRSAEAFGATGVLLLKGSVNAFNPKALRASAGSVFRVPFVQGMEEAQVLGALRESGIDLYAAVPGSAEPVSSFDLTRPCAMIIGSEGQGVRMTMRSAARDLSIPTAGVESLNAAVSAAVLLYEARRQRRHS
jgi:TrmH family RNA methyltransferase